ncbi:MAG TPA: hypothetical protein VGH66_08900, partial [Acidimicrobiales bacterium]
MAEIEGHVALTPSTQMAHAYGYETAHHLDRRLPRTAEPRRRRPRARADDHTLDVVAARCGIGSAETLRRVFLRRLNVTP